MTESFGARLEAALAARGRLCVGVDPHASLLSAWGLSDDPAGLERFSAIVVEALADRVAVFKPQSAFYERFGTRGTAVLESTIRQLRSAGALVILDVKRGDIGSTAAAYGQAYLDPSSPMYADAITVSPFLGFGSLRPMIEIADQSGSGLFVLALTSNPEGPSIQHARTADGRTVGQLILDEVSQVNAGVQPMGNVGVVVGATIGKTDHDFSSVNGPILAPGLGAQGAGAADLEIVFGDARRSVLPSYSREILGEGPDTARLRVATERALAACEVALATTS
ncbi:orotidine-5'-phosphate decarboxylase [Rugosimonospora acidiphila]|uniref:Orotidine 5'-phosphate decarboxylase n=1 Tax=Rugosimonospora acidiphila TaxID=556531 RepID=A0ABP9SSH3_9ACTN